MFNQHSHVNLYTISLVRILTTALVLFWASFAFAHGGDLNDQGCHYNRKTGDYHCHHNSPSKPLVERGAYSSPSSAKLSHFDYYASASTAPSSFSGRVIAVTDGDTIKVLDADHVTHKVRLMGIDAPEADQPFGSASRKYLATMVAAKEVLVEPYKKDRYGRVLGKVWVQPRDCVGCGKVLDANYAQILGGMAWWYKYYAHEQSPEDRGRYESAEFEAKAKKSGLWSTPNQIPPWDWRHDK